jgi:hypothetical protein
MIGANVDTALIGRVNFAVSSGHAGQERVKNAGKQVIQGL